MAKRILIFSAVCAMAVAMTPLRTAAQSTPPTAPVLADDFRILKDQDLFGHDLRTPKEDGRLANITLKQCKSACLADERCAAFTYSSNARWCFLKTGASDPRSVEGAISGIRDAASAVSEHAQLTGTRKTEVVPQLGHRRVIQSAAFSPNGARVVTGGEGGTAKLWDASTGRLLRSFTGHSDGIAAVAFSPNGARVVTGSWDSTAKLWDAGTGQLLTTFDDDLSYQDVISVAFSPDGARVLTGAKSKGGFDHGMAQLWDAGTGRLLRTFDRDAGVTSVAFSPDGSRVLTGIGSRENPGKAELWDADTGTLLGTFDAHVKVNSVAFSPDGAQVLAAGEGTVKLWNARTETPLQSFTEDYDAEIQHVATMWAAFLPDGARVLTVSAEINDEDSPVKVKVSLWDAIEGKVLTTSTWRKGEATWHDALAISPDGARALTGSRDGTAELQDAHSGKPLRSFAGHSYGVISVAFSPDGSRILTGNTPEDFSQTGENGKANLWDAGTGRLLRTFDPHAGVTSIAFSPDGGRVLAGGSDGTAKLWDAETEKLLSSFTQHSGGVTSVAFSPDGAQVLIGSERGTAKLWDARTGKLLKTLTGDSYERISSVAFSPERRHVLTCSEWGNVKLWDVRTGNSVWTSKSNGSCTSVTFSSDGRLALAGGHLDFGRGGRPGAMALLDARTGKSLLPVREGEGYEHDADELFHMFPHFPRTITSVAFSPDGAQVLIGSADGTAKLCEPTGKLLRTFTGHSDDVNSVAFSSDADGARALTGSSDGTARLWDTKTGQLLVTMIAAGDGEWLTITSRGFFTGSPKGEELLKVVRGFESYSIRQFYDQFYRPELVRELLTGDVTGRHKDAAATLDLEKVLNSGPVPKIQLLEKQLDAAGETIQFKIQLSHGPRGRGIGRRLIWRLNGNPVGETEPPELKDKQTSRGPVTVPQGIKIDPRRKNVVTVTAYNGANLFETKPYEIKIDRFGIQTPHSAPRSRMFIMAIGVNTYEKAASQLVPLDFPVKDVLKLAKAFKTVAEDGGYAEPVEIIDLTQKKAVRTTIEKAFADLAKRVSRQDALIVLLSGHGESVAGTYYYYPSDTQLGNGHTIYSAGIKTETWARWIASVQVSKKLFIVDTCKSWAARAAVKSTDTERIVQESMANRIQKAVGHSVLTAARDAALESPTLGHGVLTYAVLSALGKPNPAKEEIDVKDIDEYVVPEVKRISLALGKEQQTRNKIDSNFPVGRPNPKIAPPPFKLVQVKPGKYVVCGQVIVRSKPSTEDGKIEEVLNEQGGGCTEVGVMEFKGSWSKIARAGLERGWVPAGAVQKLSR